MKNLVFRYSYSLISFAVVLIVWELASRLSGWSTQVFPSPLVVAKGGVELLLNGKLVRDSVASLFRVTIGFDLAVLIGIPLGIILGRTVKLSRFVSPLIQFLRPISPLAWIPLAMLWFGIGEKPAVFLIFLSSFFPLVTSTVIAMHSIKPIYFQVASNFGFSRREVLLKVIFPAILPDIVTALRMTIGIAWLVVVAAEMIAVQSGLGYLILDSRNALRMDYVMVGMVTIGIIGLMLDYMMRRLSEIAELKWRTLAS
jgi:NitT/TauT family transport system permease protein